MLREQTFEKLSSLKLHGMAQAFEQQLENPDSAALGFEDRLAMLVEALWLWRENQAIKSRLRHATLKMPATIEDINYCHATVGGERSQRIIFGIYSCKPIG